jgi:hypothetical protein
MRARTLKDKLVPDELTKDTAQALFGNAKNAEQLGDGQMRMAPDKMNNPMVRAPETVAREDRIRLSSEIAIGKKQQLDPLAHLLLGRIVRVGG